MKEKKKTFSRRDFIRLSGGAALTLGASGLFPGMFWVDEGLAAIPASEGYLLVDTKKCQGCLSCMLACSLVHEGVENLSNARIQVIQDSFNSFPDDLTLEQCRQCVDPACVKICPRDALTVNSKHGNVRMVDEDKCIGCGSCVKACPYTPARTIPAMNANGYRVAKKCDLCANTPFHWDEAGGGPKGKQACVEVCPLSAIKFTKEVPEQPGDKGYKVNLRNNSWDRLGYPTD
jgi:protein NrfC